jgi:hypothetical protein
MLRFRLLPVLVELFKANWMIAFNEPKNGTFHMSETANRTVSNSKNIREKFGFYLIPIFNIFNIFRFQ